MNLRKITSLTLLTSFLLLVLTSIILYIVPHGRVAYWADWRLWGLSKTQWGNLHINLGFLFLLAGLLHLYYNWNPILSYMKNQARQLSLLTPSLAVSLVLCLVAAAGTLLEIPPMSTVIAVGEGFKDRAAEKYGEPPYGHAELSPLFILAKKTDLDPVRAQKALTDAGIKGVSDRVTLAELAQRNRTTPKALFALMQQAALKQDAPERQTLPDTPPPGFGRRTLADVCSAYGLDLEKMLAGLKAHGIQASGRQTIKEIAADNKTDPHALYPVLYDLATR